MNLELIISCSSIVIAISASAATIWQGILLKRHNELSVQPFLRIDTRNVMNEKGIITLKNVGLGPARIESIEIYINGKLLNSDEPKQKMEKALQMIDSSQRGNYYTLYQGEFFAVGESHWLFELGSENKEPDDCIKVTEKFNRLSLVIKYQSIYSKQFESVYNPL